MHLGAESHSDRSIDGPPDFVQTNIFGTAVMLECARDYYSKLDSEKKGVFAFTISLQMKFLAAWVQQVFLPKNPIMTLALLIPHPRRVLIILFAHGI